MRLPDWITRELRLHAARIIASRPPEFTVYNNGMPYLRRWFIVRQGKRWLRMPEAERRRILAEDDPRDDGTRWHALNVFVHQFWQSDNAVVHDHPWRSAGIMLDSCYLEHVPVDPRDTAGPTRSIRRRAGDVVIRAAAHAPHRVELVGHPPVTTLFITGPKRREWGFHCPDGWVHWRRFIKRGCE